MFGLILIYLTFAGGLVAIVASILATPRRGEIISGATIALSWIVLILFFLVPDTTVLGLNLDDYSRFFSTVFLLVTTFAVISMWGEDRGLLMGLSVASTGGMIAVAASTDLLTILVALKTSEAPLLLAIALGKESSSKEAAMKYFILTLIGAGFLVYGMALLGAITGSFNLVMIAQQLTAVSAESLLGLIFVFVGLAIELAVVPFHIWMPDAYQGSYPPIASILSSGSKKASFAAAFKILIIATPLLRPYWGNLFLYFSLLTMTFGNLLALVQTNVRRMLAYSSIAQAGYIMMAFAGASIVLPFDPALAQQNLAGGLLHIINHSVLTSTLFIAAKIGSRFLGENIEDWKGAAYRSLPLALSISIMLFSLAGIPLLGGFFSKLYLFRAVLEAGLPWLALAAFINSALSLGYYARWAGYMFMGSASPRSPIRSKSSLIVYAGAVLTVFLGVEPRPILALCLSAASSLLI